MSGVASSQTWPRVKKKKKQAPTCPRQSRQRHARNSVSSRAQQHVRAGHSPDRQAGRPSRHTARAHASSHGGDLAPDRSRVGPARRRCCAASPAGRGRGSCGEGRTSGADAGGRERRPEGRRGAEPGLGSRAAPGAGRLRARAPHARPLPLQGSMCEPVAPSFDLISYAVAEVQLSELLVGKWSNASSTAELATSFR